MHKLLDEFWLPASNPTTDYQKNNDTEMYMMSDEYPIVLEIVKSTTNAFSFRYNAWVAWRDAGHKIISHSWHYIYPDSHSIIDNVEDIKLIALNHSKTKNLKLKGEWEK